jgi:phage terminase small subunit
LSNGFNASAAYKAAYPSCLTDTTARTNGWRLLTNAHVKAFLAKQLEDRWKPLHMSGDEALARVAQHARIDTRQLFDEKGELLKPHLWPDAIAGSVKSVQDGPYGLKVTLVDPLTAQRIVLEVTGKVKSGDQNLAALLADLLSDKPGDARA